MKAVIAFIRPSAVQRVVHALHQIPGVSGATFTSGEGFGRGLPSDRPVHEVLYGTDDRMRVEVMIRDELEGAVVSAIREAARTGSRGDGKIYVVRVDRAIRIATGEEGEAVA